jgi:hypothetical protein
MPGRRTLGKLCSIRRGNNSSAHVNQEFRPPLILRALTRHASRPAHGIDQKQIGSSCAPRGWPRSVIGASTPRRAQSRRRTLGTLCSIRRGNNSSAHVNHGFRTPLILRALRCGILGPAVQLAKWAKPHPARRGWPRYARMFGASRHRSVPSVGISPDPCRQHQS